MFKKSIFLFISLFICSNSLASSDYHAPIGVMTDHVHKKGELMASYRYSLMNMKGLRNNQDKVSTSSALQTYMAAPKDMQMQMHMLGFMYGLTDKLTTSLMGSFVQKDMNHTHRSKPDFKREASDFGDTKVNTLYQFYNSNNKQALINLGVSIPTGEIKEAHKGTRLPYAMQIGSGSYEALPGLTYKSFHNDYSFGVQGNATFRLNTNNNGYKLGDKYNLTSWLSKKFSEKLSVSTRLDYQIFEAIESVDQTISNTMMIATRDTSLYDGRRLDLSFGVNYLFNDGIMKDNRLALEIGTPIYQRLDGPMLEVDYKLTVGWQKTF
jgi:hypothetical protein